MALTFKPISHASYTCCEFTGIAWISIRCRKRDGAFLLSPMPDAERDLCASEKKILSMNNKKKTELSAKIILIVIVDEWRIFLMIIKVCTIIFHVVLKFCE